MTKNYSSERQLRFRNRMSAERWKIIGMDIPQKMKDYHISLVDAKETGYEQGRFDHAQRQIPPKRARPSMDYLVAELANLK